MSTVQLSQLLEKYLLLGHRVYGIEPVSQLEHALQCASLAVDAQESNEMVSACLFHDVGHLLRPDDLSSDAQHEISAANYLQKLFGHAVIQPIKLHVDAKRYLCTIDSNYWGTLSQGSKHSLQLQGGPFSKIECEEFLKQAFAAEAIRLRQYDDLAKIPQKKTLSVDDLMPMIESCLLG